MRLARFGYSHFPLYNPPQLGKVHALGIKNILNVQEGRMRWCIPARAARASTRFSQSGQFVDTGSLHPSEQARSA